MTIPVPFISEPTATPPRSILASKITILEAQVELLEQQVKWLSDALAIVGSRCDPSFTFPPPYAGKIDPSFGADP